MFPTESIEQYVRLAFNKKSEELSRVYVSEVAQLRKETQPTSGRFFKMLMQVAVKNTQDRIDAFIETVREACIEAKRPVDNEVRAYILREVHFLCDAANRNIPQMLRNTLKQTRMSALPNLQSWIDNTSERQVSSIESRVVRDLKLEELKGNITREAIAEPKQIVTSPPAKATEPIEEPNLEMPAAASSSLKGNPDSFKEFFRPKPAWLLALVSPLLGKLIDALNAPTWLIGLSVLIFVLGVAFYYWFNKSKKRRAIFWVAIIIYIFFVIAATYFKSPPVTPALIEPKAKTLSLAEKPSVIAYGVSFNDSGTQFQVQFHNSGQSVATGLGTSARVAFTNIAHFDPTGQVLNEPTSYGNLAPGDSIVTKVDTSKELVPAQFKKMKKGALFCFVFGFARYNDLEGISHEPRFCYRWSVEEDGFVACPENGFMKNQKP